MCILISSKKTIKGQDATIMFFEKVSVHFEIPRSIISDKDIGFLNAFWTRLWVKMDTEFKRSTTFLLQMDGKTKVVNKTLVHLLRGYN
jgi:hypothetical protein